MRVHHIAMRTRQLAQLETFYTAVLGLEIVQRDGTRSVWLRLEGALLMLEQAEPGEPDVPRGTMELLAFAVDVADVDRWRRALAAGAIPIEQESAYTIYFRDPDGRRVALSHFPGE